MPFVNLDFDSAKESQTVSEDMYALRVAKFDLVQTKRAKEEGRDPDMYKAVVVIDQLVDGVSNPSPIVEYFVLPGKDDEYANLKILNLKRFLHCFGIPFEGDGFNDEDVVSSTGECLIVKETMTDSGGHEMTDENGAPRFVNRMSLPRLPNED